MPVKHRIDLFTPTGTLAIKAASYTTPGSVLRIVLPDNTIVTTSFPFIATEIDHADEIDERPDSNRIIRVA